MAMHEALAFELAGQCDQLLRRVDSLKRYMILVAKLVDDDREKWYELSLEARGSAVVGCCAELEALTRVTLQRSHEEINALQLEHRQAESCLRQLAAHSAFESLRSLQDHSKLWERRAFTTTLDSSIERVKLPIVHKSAQLPLDGRTLHPEHFYRMWGIYGLGDAPFPQVTWATSLQKLALMRNDIAHGNIPIAEVFKQAGSSEGDVERYVDDVGYFAMHFTAQWATFMQDEKYLRI